MSSHLSIPISAVLLSMFYSSGKKIWFKQLILKTSLETIHSTHFLNSTAYWFFVVVLPAIRKSDPIFSDPFIELRYFNVAMKPGLKL